MSDFTPHQQCALYFGYGDVEQITDIKGLMHVNPKLLQFIIEWKIVASTCGLINAQVMQILGLDSELLKLEKAIQGIESENITKVFQYIASMSPQEKSRVLGNITGAFVQAEILTAAMPTALKRIEKITQVVAESRVGQSLAQSVQKLEKFAQGAARIGTAEKVIAVTAEGIPVRIATAAEEIMSFQNTAQKVGGTAKEIVKDTEKTIADLANNIVNQTQEAVLKNGYYEVNSFKFSEYYYNRLWGEGRQAPTLAAKKILDEAIICTPDIKKVDFFRYEFDGWEMVYNPTTKEVWHIQQITKKKK